MTHYLTLLICTVLLITAHESALANSDPCGNSPEAAILASLVSSHPDQQRKKIRCNQKLNEIALIKASYIIENQDIWHHAGHMAPNQLLRHHGFKLPDTYPLFGNQVEALASGVDSAEQVFTDFLNSSPHRRLLLGEDEFFEEQDQIGIAFIKDLDTDHEYYWVVIIADEKKRKIKQAPRINIESPVVSNKKKSRGREIKDKMYRQKVRGKIH
ncbi:MAG: CAP domain-containing protein [Marinicella sp.]